jgi:hypothetical protein
MIRISTGTQIALIARIALHLSYSDLTTPPALTGGVDVLTIASRAKRKKMGSDSI